MKKVLHLRALIWVCFLFLKPSLDCRVYLLKSKVFLESYRSLSRFSENSWRNPFLLSLTQEVGYWRKNVPLLPVNRLGGLNLPRNSVVDMTIAVYRGRKAA